MGNTYTITEYGSLVAGCDIKDCKGIPERVFNALENFILSNRNKETDALELLGIYARKGIGKVITAKNYVGIIAMKDGTTIEILPKIYSREAGDDVRAKKLLIDMLKTLHNSPCKNLQSSNVNIAKMNIFDIFIRMFINEVFFIAKRRLRRGYETVSENSGVFKGKLIFSEHIKRNFAHKERSFVEYDMFSSNRAENKVIKVALLYLYRRASSVKNKTDIKTLLGFFNDVEPSEDYKTDFKGIIDDRNMKDYKQALAWSRIFLDGKSFTSFSGSEVSLALLFPMEALFESYITKLLKKELNGKEFSVSAQDKTHYLFDEPVRKFLIKPDIAVRRKSDNEVFIFDTKWKLLSDNKPNLGIAQPDMYQMYAYGKKYCAESVTLVYPFSADVGEREYKYKSKDGVEVQVKFIDLYDVKKSISTIAESLYIYNSIRFS